MKFKARKQKREPAAAIDRGRKLHVSGHPEETFEFLQKAIRQFPDDPELRLLYATILLVFKPEDVAAEASKAVDLSPHDPLILVRAAHLMLHMGNHEGARSYAARANELAQPDFVRISGLISLNGLIAALDGEDDIAEERLRLAMKEEPRYSNFAVNLAKFWQVGAAMTKLSR